MKLEDKKLQEIMLSLLIYEDSKEALCEIKHLIPSIQIP